MVTPDHEFTKDVLVALEPRTDSRCYAAYNWPSPEIVSITNRRVALTNNTKFPILLHKNDQVCHIRPVSTVVPSESSSTPKVSIDNYSTTPHLTNIIVDPDKQLSLHIKKDFCTLHQQYEHVFNPNIGQYNDYSGKVRARIHVAVNKPPTRKLQVPSYCHKNQELLQHKFDELERFNVFSRPESIGVQVEHVSPSFLVHKKNGGHRLVTSFVALSPYCKVLPTTMPTVDSILRSIAAWRFIIVTDLCDAFYQIPMDKNSMKWCGTPTPFRGLRCYTVAAQGMPGASEALEELLSLIFGEEVKNNIVGKIADDLCIGGTDESDLLRNWSLVLDKLSKNNLSLKASKTIIAPKRVQLLGWDWLEGKISASVHKISPLYNATPPESVTKLRSFIGAYKFFNRVIPQCANLIGPLESSISGKKKNDPVPWNNHLLELYHKAQSALKEASTIHLPRSGDQLIIVHDGSTVGIGSVLYLNRKGKLLIGAFFSAKLKDHQTRWYPCEIEALSIAISIHHFSPYIRNSQLVTQVLTDNRPCVQAWERMKRGQFCTSSRVASFLSTLAEFNVEIQHISGVQNLPSDFQSRNPPICDSPLCQVCIFVCEAGETVVRSISVNDILSGRISVPFNNRSVWKSLQKECPDLSRVHLHLRYGTRPTAKSTKMTTVKRYLSSNTIISKDGLLVVMHSEPFHPPKELIVVPEQLIHGLLTSLHLTLNHATVLQLMKVFKRQFFALRAQHYAEVVLDNCHTCRSLKVMPKEYHLQSTVNIPVTPGRIFSSDIVRRFRQKIFVLRDNFSSFTSATLQPNEDHDTLRTALIQSTSLLRPNPHSRIEVRVDNAPGFKALKNDLLLTKANISLDFGRVKNINKNPVVDKAIQELITEILKFNTDVGPITPDSLAIVVNHLNSRIRNRGLSAWEILHQRDHDSGVQLDMNDRELSILKENERLRNQHSSATSKAAGADIAPSTKVVPGSLVYIKSDSNKNRGRERYVVVKVNGSRCTLKKMLKTQLRAQEYELKLNEIMLVTPNTECRVDYRKGFDSSDEEPPDEPTPEPEPVEMNIIPHGQYEEPVEQALEPHLEPEPVEVNNVTHDQNEALVPNVVEEESIIVNNEAQAQRRSNRNRRKPTWLEDYET